MKRCLVALVAISAMFGAALLAAGTASAAKKGNKPLVVCEFGCKYKSIQKAAEAAGPGGTVQIEPGKYKEGVILDGNENFKNLTIEGTSKNASKVVLDGKNAKSPEGLAQNGIEAIDVTGLTVKNMTVKNYATNGIFLRDSNASDSDKKYPCADYLLKNTVTSFNRSYGLFAFGCVGGRMTKSTGFGHGDSAFYIGATPAQKKPKKTSLDHLDGHENVLGFSGTNARYVTIKESNFYNNGTGIVPNTLDTEPYEPADTGVIKDNNVFWNNFNYFLPNSRVTTISDGIAEIDGVGVVQYPTGVGIVLLGTTGWVVKDNNIFGNFKWGAATFSNPFNEGDDAISTDNQFLNNQMGKSGTDVNAVDFFIDGSGSGNCFAGNVSSTFDAAPGVSDSELYPACPAPAAPNPGASTTSFGNLDQVAEGIAYLTADPPEDQECQWTPHPHPAYKNYKPLAVTPGPTCP